MNTPAIERRRILDFFESEVYGPMPPRPSELRFEPMEEGPALGGVARRRQFRVASRDVRGGHAFDALVYLPASGDGPFPAFVCPNTRGNHTVSHEPEVAVPDCPVLRSAAPDPAARGGDASRLPIRDIVSAGFAVATFCHSAVFPDYTATPGRDRGEGAGESVWKIFAEVPGRPALALSAWAWGDCRVLDLLETLPEIDARRIAVAGHSRLAFAASIAAAFDERFALCCLSGGGCKSIRLVPNLRFPAWFAPGLRKWTAIAESGLPVAETEARRGALPSPPFDTGALLGCIAPRGLHVAASRDDIYAPPEVQFSGVEAASAFYRLAGATRLPPRDAMLSPEPFFGDISWHCKPGPHSITPEDWTAFLAGAMQMFL
ncbi:MAG: hypothetical protein IJP66_09080 [Kiritimatiellae bacterium]|nr:hypothetical protein [Kiritimatiellia bacterium]